jgi:hypothetical protein
MIKVDTKDAIRELEALQKTHSRGDINQAMVRAIRHTLQKTKTEANRVIRETYKIPVSQANKAMNVRVLRASSTQGPAGALMASSSRTPLAAFRPTMTTSSGVWMQPTNKGFMAAKAKRVRRVQSTTMQIEIIRGKRMAIRSAFFLPSSPRAVVMARGVYAANRDFQWRHRRISPSGMDMPIDALSSVSVFKAVTTEKAQLRISKGIGQAYEQRFLHEMARLSASVTN